MAHDVIILNRMYAGDYLGENIGHEVINLIKPDKGNDYYVYINDDGRVNENFLNKKWNAKCILFTRWCTREYKDDKEKTKTLSMIEILAKTEGTLECILDDNKDYKQQTDDFYEKHKEKLKNVTYGGKNFEEIFKNNEHYKYKNPVYATFKAENIIKVNKNKRLYMVDSKINNYIIKQIKKDNEEFIYINDKCPIDKIKSFQLNFSKQSLKQYIINGEYGDNKNFNQVYKNLKEKIINKSSYWLNNTEIKTYNQMKKDGLIVTGNNKNNFIGIIRQEYDELIYTNMFFYIFKTNPQLFCSFANKILNIKKTLNADKLKFVREEGNIDLLVCDDDTLIVIENKIKSGINGLRHDEAGKEVGNQLCKYALYAFGEKVKSGSNKLGYTYENFSEKYKKYKNRYFFIFSPTYKQFSEERINKNIQKYLRNKDFTKYADEKEKLTYKQRKSIYYNVKTYGEIYDFFETYFNENDKPKYYNEFLYALGRHSNSVDNIQERQMFERFAERIEELNKPCPKLT